MDENACKMELLSFMDVLRSYCENFTINEGYIVFGRRIYWPQSSQHNKALANDFFLMRKNCFPLVRWTTYTNQAMYTLNIYRYSTIYRYLSYIWLSLCDTLDQKRWGNRYPHNSKRLPDKTCYFSTSIKTQLASFWMQLGVDITKRNMGDLLAKGGRASEGAGGPILDVLTWSPPMVCFPRVS